MKNGDMSQAANIINIFEKFSNIKARGAAPTKVGANTADEDANAQQTELVTGPMARSL